MFYVNFTSLGSGSLALEEYVDLEANTFQELTRCPVFHRRDECLEATPTQTKVLGLYNYFLMGSAQSTFVVRWVLFWWSLYRYKKRGGGNSPEVAQLALRMRRVWNVALWHQALPLTWSKLFHSLASLAGAL